MQAEQTIQPTQPLVPHPPEERAQLAPKQGLEPKKFKPQSEGYDEFLKKVCKQIDTECDERAEVRAKRYTRNHNYWWGGERRWMYWTKEGFKSLPAKQVKRLFSNNQFFYQVKTILSTATRSHPRLVVTPAPAVQENEQKTSAAKVATRTLQHDQREKLTAEFIIREWTDRILCGFAVRGQWYTKEGSTAKARMPIVEQREMQMPGEFVCSTCGAKGPEDMADQHEHEVDVFPGETISVPIHAGYEEVPAGDTLTYGISPYEFDLAPESRDLPSSPYARWQRRVRKSTLKKAYQNVELKALPPADLPVMLQAQEAVKSRKTIQTKDFTVLKTYWLSPDMYWEFSSQIALKTVSGMEIPAGTMLTEIGPNGLRVDICGTIIIDIRPEVKEDCLTMSPFYLDPLSWEAKGLDDAAELQRWIDDIWTLYVQIQLRDALGITTYDKGMFSAGKFTGEVGSVVGVDVPEDKKLSDAIDIKEGPQPHASIFNGLQYAEQSQTNVTGAFPSLSGSNMEGSETARGRIILREQSLQGLGPQLFLAARHDVVWAKQNLKLKKQYWTSERYVPYLEDDEPLGGRWFTASDLDTDFIVDVEADSWMPLTRMDEIDNMTTYMGGEAAMGAIPGGFSNPIVPKAIRGKAAELLNVPSGTDPDEKDLRVAQHRYSVLKQAIEMATGQQDIPEAMNSPLLVAPQEAMKFAMLPSVQPLPDVDKHDVFIEFYRNAIKDAVDGEGVENSPVMKATLMLLIKAHENQGVMDVQSDQMMAMEAQAPQMMAQQAQQQQQNDQETAKSDQAHQQGLEKQAQGSQLKRQEMAAKPKSELSKVKV